MNVSSALCAIGQGIQGNSSVNVIAEISGQLQRERQKNAELMEKISILEAQLQERDINQSLATDIGEVRFSLSFSFFLFKPTLISFCRVFSFT